jgi:hypothetical protein
MNHKITLELLNNLKPYITNADIDVSGKNQDYNSDFVMIDNKNNIGFEVFDNEIIVFYFNEHCHFEDCTSEQEQGKDDYTKRAELFLLDLFQFKIRHKEVFKGKTLCAEKYYIMYPNGKEGNYIGGTWFGLSKFINPFRKKKTICTTWQYDKSKGCFIKTSDLK